MLDCLHIQKRHHFLLRLHLHLVNSRLLTLITISSAEEPENTRWSSLRYQLALYKSFFRRILISCRLPNHTWPLHYTMRITPDMNEFVYSISSEIDIKVHRVKCTIHSNMLQVTKPVDTIVMHAMDLYVHSGITNSTLYNSLHIFSATQHYCTYNLCACNKVNFTLIFIGTVLSCV